MQNEELFSELQALIGDYLQSKGVDLVELIYRHEGRDLVLRVLADYPSGGITIGECAALNRELGAFLDEKNIPDFAYTLEVSSPGIDRPMRQKKDFLRNCGKDARFFLKEMVAGKVEWAGSIESVDENAVYLREVKGALLPIPLAMIQKAVLIIE
jgi:ribosome maturation factor RimP